MVCVVTQTRFRLSSWPNLVSRPRHFLATNSLFAQMSYLIWAMHNTHSTDTSVSLAVDETQASREHQVTLDKACVNNGSNDILITHLMATYLCNQAIKAWLYSGLSIWWVIKSKNLVTVHKHLLNMHYPLLTLTSRAKEGRVLSNRWSGHVWKQQQRLATPIEINSLTQAEQCVQQVRQLL